MVIIGYSDGRGRSAWIKNDIADHLVKSLKRPTKRAAGTRPLYIVRCRPKQIEGAT
jgi:hypothetical protein